MSTTRQARSGPSTPLQLERAGVLDDEAAGGEPVRSRADEDLARPRRLLEPRGEVDGLARGERRLGVVDDDLARLDPDPRLEPQLVDRRAHRERRARRALRVVLVRLRDAERRHHGVAGELLDDAAVLLDAARDLLEELRDAPADDLGVGARDEPRRVDDVDEQDRCELSLHD